jgi:hypothetical protein
MVFFCGVDMLKKSNPHITVRLTPNLIPGRDGYSRAFEVVCEYFSPTKQAIVAWHAPLERGVCKKITDCLLTSKKFPGDFVDSDSERRRVSKYIADNLESIVSRHSEAYKKYGYPTRFQYY